MIILTDCDGVLADLVGALCSELAGRGFNRTPDDVKHFDFSLSFTEDEMRAVHEIMRTPGFVHALDWYEGARAFLRELAREGDVHAVTAPFRDAASWMHERLAWLASEVQGDRVHFVAGKYKHLVRGDVLIEDHPTTASDWCTSNPNGVAVLIDRPWNRPGSNEWRLHANMYRAGSFDDALRIVRECM